VTSLISVITVDRRRQRATTVDGRSTS